MTYRLFFCKDFFAVWGHGDLSILLLYFHANKDSLKNGFEDKLLKSRYRKFTVKFVILEKFTRAYKHQIALEIMLLLLY